VLRQKSTFHLAYIVTHPIQYQSPLLRLIAASGEIDLRVFFLSDLSLHAHHEMAFARTFKWDVPLTDGFCWEVLPRWGIGPSTRLRPAWPVYGLEKKLGQDRFDAVWVHGWGHVGLRQGIRAAHRLGIPVLLRGETTPDSSRATGLRRWVRDAYCRRMIGLMSAALYIGSLNREFYCRFGVSKEKLFHVPYAVDNAWFQSRTQHARTMREALRQEMALTPGRPIILFVAKFIPVKAAGDLLAAYKKAWGGQRGAGSWDAKAESEMQEAGSRKPYLLFVGDGPLRRELETEAGTMLGVDIHFLGFKNQSQLPALYDLCDVFVLPSHYEPWGLVLNEAMNAGKPAIVSDRVGAWPDLVQPGVNGWVFPCADVTALARCLKEAMATPALATMGRRSLEMIKSWGFEADLQGLLAALRRVVIEK
jgi:glycosyltransferase involved in cell wall biosynthesis